MSTVIDNIRRLLTGKQENPKLTPAEVVEDLERRFKELDGLSFREVDEKLGVRATNRSASGRGYMSPRFYKRIPVQTPEQKRKREEKATRILRGSG